MLCFVESWYNATSRDFYTSRCCTSAQCLAVVSISSVAGALASWKNYQTTDKTTWIFHIVAIRNLSFVKIPFPRFPAYSLSFTCFRWRCDAVPRRRQARNGIVHFVIRPINNILFSSIVFGEIEKCVRNCQWGIAEGTFSTVLGSGSKAIQSWSLSH